MGSIKEGKASKPAFIIGDVVRVSRSKGVFEKGYDVSWSRETFTITCVDPRRAPVVYRLKDSSDEVIKGTFYTQELQKVKHKELYLVEEVLKERGTGARKELFVKWLGYPSSANSWISALDAANL